jgi:glycosyltransferase involved in cell wall biosynthesis
MSDTVGCKHEFGQWARSRVFPEGSAQGLADALASLVDMPRDFDWARQAMQAYTTEAAASALVKVMKEQVSGR